MGVNKMNEKYLIESNGQRYGPADLDQLIQWVAEGRIVSTTVLINAETSERKLAGDHADLRSWFPPQPPASAPGGATSYQAPSQQGRAGDVGGLSGIGGGAYTGGYQQQQQQQQMPRPPEPYGGGYQQAVRPGYGPGMYDVGSNNDSGTGATARLPAELQGVNLGAFAIPIWWSIFNRSYIGLLALIPCVGVIMSVVLLFKGNEWAWQNRRFESIEHFRQVQQAWQKWGIAVFIINIIWAIISLIGRNN